MGEKIKTAHIKEALLKNYGNMAAAAQALGTTRQNISQRVQRSEELQKIREEAEEQSLDLAENSLLSQIRDKNTAATIFYLKTRGKHRGYIEPQHLIHSGGVEVSGKVKSVVILPPKIEDDS